MKVVTKSQVHDFLVRISVAAQTDAERASFLERKLWEEVLEACAVRTGNDWETADMAAYALKSRQISFRRGYTP